MKCKHCQKEYPTLRGGYCGPCKRLWEPKNTDILLKNVTSVQLLQELGQRIATGEIRPTYLRGFPYLGIWEEKTGKRIIEVCLSNGKIEPKEEETKEESHE